uniref:Uncharacterized protein n=1 Tax=Odontella aurita TaxID=265563 RepID=A0A7S4JXX5_9STRA
MEERERGLRNNYFHGMGARKRYECASSLSLMAACSSCRRCQSKRIMAGVTARKHGNFYSPRAVTLLGGTIPRTNHRNSEGESGIITLLRVSDIIVEIIRHLCLSMILFLRSGQDPLEPIIKDVEP